MKKLGILFIALVGFGISSFGQNSATVSTQTANAKIIKPLTLAVGAQGLEFGIISVGTGGDITVSSADVVSSSGVVRYTATGAVTPKAATFTINGENALTYSVTLPGNTDIELKTGAGVAANDKMALSNWESTHPALDGTAKTLSVGAKLTVSATQNSGTYTATFPVTVTYN